MRINHNVLAMNSWRNLNNTNDELSKSLEKLSSGYRINRAADDPAGLVISEKLRAEITGINQAITNTQDAVSMIQVGEGALVEINTMLNSMRALALHAANTGASSTQAINADQEQIDSAVNSIASIASNTAYLGKYLLNGNSGNTGIVVDKNKIASIVTGDVSASGTAYLNMVVISAATAAVVSGTQDLGVSTAHTGSLTVNGFSVTLASTMTLGSAASSINQQLGAQGAGIHVSNNASGFVFTQSQFGATAGINITDSSSILMNATTVTTYAVVGSNVVGSINGSSATGHGLTLTADAGTNYAGTDITLTQNGNVEATITQAVSISGNAVSFQIGSNGGEQQQVSMRNVGPDQLGVSVDANGLNSIKSGGSNNLLSNPSKALQVIDAAISDISTVRANLGALQKNVLETKVRSLQVSQENLTSSESRIRDVDMAQEMMKFTRDQIMMQAGTAMLAQANSAPQSVLKLLG